MQSQQIDMIDMFMCLVCYITAKIMEQGEPLSIEYYHVLKCKNITKI